MEPDQYFPQTSTWLQLAAQTADFCMAFRGSMGPRHQHGPWPYQGYQSIHLGPSGATWTIGLNMASNDHTRHSTRCMPPQGKKAQGHHRVISLHTSAWDLSLYWAAVWTTDANMASGGPSRRSDPGSEPFLILSLCSPGQGGGNPMAGWQVGGIGGRRH